VFASRTRMNASPSNKSIVDHADDDERDDDDAREPNGTDGARVNV
jgi:Cu/Zn superoxide dismutase